MVRTIQVAQKSIKHHNNKWKNLENKELKNLEDSSTKSFKRHETEFDFKPRRAQGGKGLLSHTILVQKLKNPWLDPTPREEKGGRTWEGEKERAPGLMSLSPGNQGERGGAGLFVSWEPAHPLPVGSPFFPSKSSSKD